MSSKQTTEESRQSQGRRRRGRVPARLARPSPLCLLSSALCLLLAAYCLLPFAAAQKEKDAEDAPAQSATFHRWGAVTIFHGLPSDRVRAIAQDAEGLMWFGTDAGLARYDGRRTQTITDEGLAARRILALRFDEEGALWVGTDAGAFLRTPEGAFQQLDGTKGKEVASIITPARGRAVLATADGLILDYRKKDDGSYSVAPLAERITPTPAGAAGTAAAQTASASKQPLEVTSLAAVGEAVLVGTRGRGLLAVERGAVKEIASRPRAFFVEAIERDAAGRVHLGVQTSGAESGLFRLDTNGGRDVEWSALRASKVAGEATGTVTALRLDRRGDLYVGTDGRGVYRLHGEEHLERFTFAGTAGALRSDRIFSIFIDREGVAWFGTDRGVCRYDPHGLRVENISDEASDANFIRAVFRTSTGRLLVGTNRGLFVRDAASPAWSHVEALGKRTVYAIQEDTRGRVLVGSAGGLYASLPLNKSSPSDAIRFVPEELKEEKAADDAGAKEEAKPEGQTGDAAAEASSGQSAGGEGKTDAETKAETEKPAESTRTARPAVTGSVRAIAILGGTVYVATFGRGVERLDEDLRRTTVWPKWTDDDARGRETISLYADDAGGRLWIGTSSAGVFYLDGEGVRSDPAYESLASSTVWGVSAGRDGLIWLATSRGLYAHRPGSPLLEVVPQMDARAVVVTGAGASQETTPHAWCATAGGGLIKVLLDEQFGPVTARLDAEHGLPSQNAFAMLALDAQDAGGGQTLLVGTARGLALYEPGGAPPVLRPTSLVASRPLPLEELQSDRPLRLEYPQNALVFEVAAHATRTFPEQFQYAFLLQDEANKVIKRKLSHDAQFQVESLKPGRYRVTARAFSSDLAPSAPLAFEFVVTKAPFPWTTAALSTLLALALVALVWGYVQHRKIVRAGSDLMEANRQLAAARLQLANEAESERRRIARDLHDQTLADLRRLLLLADEMQTESASVGGNGAPVASAVVDGSVRVANALDPSVLRAEIESISQEIRRICEDLSPSVLENVGFAAALEWAVAERVAHMPPDCKFAYEFHCEDGLEERLHFSAGVQMQVYRIVQEAVSNVCRHAQATRVRLAVEINDENEFLLTLEDNGRGFDTDKRKSPAGRGLASIRARASMIDARVRWQHRSEEEGGGTRFTLRKARGERQK